MRYTIEGFSQEFALTLRKEVEQRGKKTVKKIDCTDLVILRWFVDFFPFMKKVEVDGKQYGWITHKKLMEDLPLLDVSKRALMDRMQKLVDFDILTYKLVKEGGTFSLFGFGENYKYLVDGSKKPASDAAPGSGGMPFKQQGVCRSNNIGGVVQTADKDTSINDSSIKDKDEGDKRDKKDTTKGEMGFPPPVTSSQRKTDNGKTEKAKTLNDIKLESILKGEETKAGGIMRPTFLTKMLIKGGYIAKDDPYIPDYNQILYDAEVEAGSKDLGGFERVRDCVAYFLKQIKGKRDNIVDRKAYFEASLAQSLKRTDPEFQEYLERMMFGGLDEQEKGGG